MILNPIILSLVNVLGVTVLLSTSYISKLMVGGTVSMETSLILSGDKASALPGWGKVRLSMVHKLISVNMAPLYENRFECCFSSLMLSET